MESRHYIKKLEKKKGYSKKVSKQFVKTAIKTK